MSNELLDRLDKLEGSAFTDPQAYMEALYGAEAEQGETPAPAAQEPAPEKPASEGETAAKAAESSEAPAAAPAPAEDPAPAGVATKDGKHVIPYNVLEQERVQRREAEKREAEMKARAAEMQAELQRLKDQGATSQQQSDAIEAMFSEEELAELAEDAPAIKKLHDAYTALAAKLKAEQTAKAAREAEEAAARQRAAEEEARDVAAAQVNAALQGLPLLTKWRDTGGGLWSDAVALDKQLAEANPAMGMAERFSLVQQRIADQYGIPIPSAAPAPSQAKPKAPSQPKEVLPTLTDFSGGPVVVDKDPLAGLTPGQAVDKAMTMSMEDIRRMAGLTY